MTAGAAVAARHTPGQTQEIPTRAELEARLRDAGTGAPRGVECVKASA